MCGRRHCSALYRARCSSVLQQSLHFVLGELPFVGIRDCLVCSDAEVSSRPTKAQATRRMALLRLSAHFVTRPDRAVKDSPRARSTRVCIGDAQPNPPSIDVTSKAALKVVTEHRSLSEHPRQAELHRSDRLLRHPVCRGKIEVHAARECAGSRLHPLIGG